MARLHVFLSLVFGAGLAQSYSSSSSCSQYEDLLASLSSEGAQVSPFCTQYLGLQTATATATTTLTIVPSQSTKTLILTSTSSIASWTTQTHTTSITVTATQSQLFTATCTPHDNRPHARRAKRAVRSPCKKSTQSSPTPDPLSGLDPATVSGVCQCLGVTAPTVTITATATSTQPAPTTTVTNYVRITDYYAQTQSTGATLLATKTVTNAVTTTVLLTIQGTYVAKKGTVFDEYPGTDFAGYDIGVCSCGTGSTCTLGGISQSCQTYKDCQDVCEAFNTKNGKGFCLGVAYVPNTAPAQCWPKFAVPGNGAPGCGYIQTYDVDSAIIASYA